MVPVHASCMVTNLGCSPVTNLDVSLRLRLQNQLGRGADDAKRDLNEVKTAAERLGKMRADGIQAGLAGVGKTAREAKAALGTVGAEAEELRRKLGRVGTGSLRGLTSEVGDAKAALRSIGTEADDVRRKLGRIDDTAFDTLKSDAREAEGALNRVGAAAGELKTKLNGLRTNGVGAAPYRPGHGPSGSSAAGLGLAGLVDQAGIPIALGAGAAYVAGSATAGLGLVAGASIRGAAGDEFTSDQLRVLGEYGPEQQARYDQLMAQIGARKGTGTGGAMSVFGRLMAGGLDPESAAASTESAIMFGKATQASPEDAARTTIALRNIFGIGTDQIMAAYDAMAMGGKAGEFEVPDMAKNFPSIASKMAALGEGGMSGTQLAVALGQAIRKTAGSSDEAATNFENMLGKFRSQDFIKNAKEYGIDPDATMKSAAAAGESPVLALLDEIKTKVGMDGVKLAKLMPDVQSLAGLEASLKGLDEVRKLMTDMQASPGTVMADFATATENASSAFDRFTANVAAKAKFLAAYALPPLTEAMNAASGLMEGDNEPAQIKAPDGSSGATKQAVASANDRGARLNRLFERLFGFEPSNTSKRLNTVDAYQQYAQSRMEGERGGPSAIQRFLFGDAAGSGFDFKKHFGINLKSSAEDAMSGFNDGLREQGKISEEEAQAIADSLRSILNFSVSPTISPTIVPPAPASPAPGQQSSINSGTQINQTINSPNSQHAARSSARAIRLAQAGTYYDIGRRLA